MSGLPWTCRQKQTKKRKKWSISWLPLAWVKLQNVFVTQAVWLRNSTRSLFMSILIYFWLIYRFIFSILHFDYFKRPEDKLYIQWEVRQKRSFVWQKYVLFFIFPINHLKSPQIYLTISLVVLSWSPVPYSFTSNQVCKRLMSTWFSLTKSQISPENWWKFKAIWI